MITDMSVRRGPILRALEEKLRKSDERAEAERRKDQRIRRRGDEDESGYPVSRRR